MRVSLNIIKQFIPVELPPVNQLVERINQQLGGVEEVIDLNEKYKDAVIIKVVTAEKHPSADRLSVTKIDDGGVVADVPRDENGYVQVVCGAPNVHADMFTVWLPPKATVPSSFGDSKPFVLDARELRGVLSQGMLAAADELAIGSAHDGIIEINPDEWKPNDIEVKPGASFAKAYGLDDTIIDIENKMFTHRPDCFGQLGVAREISAILQGVTDANEGFVDTRYENPDWYWQIPEFAEATGVAIEVFNEAPNKVPRFMAVAMDGITIKPSPIWLQCAVTVLGAKPINNIVDITNYVMLMTAQPVHAYDYDKLRGHKLGARMARAGETVHLLNGKTYELDENDIIIADAEGPVGLAGIMGGGDSEVSSETTRIVLEVATFDMYTLRKSSMRHGVFTDALTRFNKGQSPAQNDRIIARLMHLLTEHAGARQASNVQDVPEYTGDKTTLSGEIEVSTDFINERLGSSLTTDQIGNLLRRVNIASYPASDDKKDSPVYAAPFWRTDIQLPEDIVEEVGRLYGFDALPRELPRRSITPAPLNPSRAAKAAIRQALSRAGANEILSYSFVHGELLTKVGQDPQQAYQLGNALSPDLQYYRLSVMPSLLTRVHMNIKAGYSELALYELGKAHAVGQLDSEGLPREDEMVAVVVAKADKTKPQGSAYFMAKRYLEQLIKTPITYKPVPDEMQNFAITKPYDPKRSALAYADDTFLGIIGEFLPNVRKALKLPVFTAGFELDTQALVGRIGVLTYQPLSRFPSTSQDISLRTTSDVSYGDLAAIVTDSLDAQANGLHISVEPIAIYQPNDDSSTKTTSFRITFTSYTRTLTDEDIAPHMEYVAKRAHTKLNAERI